MSVRTSTLMKSVAAVAGLVFAVACGSDGDSSGPQASGGSGGSGGSASGGSSGSGGSTNTTAARIRLVHASPSAPSVDVYVLGQDTPVVEALEYGKATDYLEVPAGSYAFELRAAGSEPDSEAAHVTPAIELAGGTSYSAVAAGKLGSSDLADQFRVIALEEGYEAAASGSARVRLLHAGSDAPTVDIDVGNDGSAEIEQLERFHPTAIEGVDLPSSELQVGIWAGGERVTSFSTPALNAGENVLIVATGLIADEPRETTGFSLLAVLPDGSTAFIPQNPAIYALHASPDAGPVDIYVGDDELFDAFAFGEIQKLQVPPGQYDLEFYAGHPGPTLKPGSPPVVTTKTPKLEAGQEYFVLATGLLTAQPSTFGLTAFIDSLALDETDQARVRVVHASPDAPAVDISTIGSGGTLDQPAIIPNISFSHATEPEGLGLPEASYTLGVAPAGSEHPVAKFVVPVQAGRRVYAVAAGSLTGKGDPFQLLVVDATDLTWSVASLSPQ